MKQQRHDNEDIVRDARDMDRERAEVGTAWRPDETKQPKERDLR